MHGRMYGCAMVCIHSYVHTHIYIYIYIHTHSYYTDVFVNLDVAVSSSFRLAELCFAISLSRHSSARKQQPRAKHWKAKQQLAQRPGLDHDVIRRCRVSDETTDNPHHMHHNNN